MSSVSVSEMSRRSSRCRRSFHVICFARFSKIGKVFFQTDYRRAFWGHMTRSAQDTATTRLPFSASENKPSDSIFLVGRNAKGALISIRRPCRHKSHKNPNDFIHLDTELEPAEFLLSRRLWPRTFRMGASPLQLERHAGASIKPWVNWQWNSWHSF